MKKLQLVGMLRVLKIFPIVILFGCTSVQVKTAPVSQPQKLVEVNTVIDKEALQKGGRLLIVPFKAGAGVAADEETNRISLMFVKGMSEAVESGFSFKLASSVTAQDFDFILKGYITEISQSSGPKRWFSGSKRKSLGIEGKIVEYKTDHVVYHFSRRQVLEDKEKDLKSVAYDLGREVGQFVNQL